ncbi:hypothetical protein LQ327_33355 [Actinomycetospora endophytica]|uniref:Uncharacterized protein n=1 Tax=Actinomycetospora endophytica TaxID=2291215 RepID=A0ABS8PMS8_9PSEU|nr:hypothetical protein [Actinomycetospora endophytica]MCD2198264.1 hypothetical protein [Actinomycetospora endophytica]
MNENIAELHRRIRSNPSQMAAQELPSRLQSTPAVFCHTERGPVCEVCGTGPFVDDDAETSHRA